MEVVNDRQQKIMCPYNKAHYILKFRIETHLKKCRAAYTGNDYVTCDFNASHSIPEPEKQYHHNTCPDRKVAELQIYKEDVPTFAPQASAPSILPPVDYSWDDDPVETYNPQKYCEENKVFRRLDTASAAKKRDFRISERHRFNNLSANKVESAPVKDQRMGPAPKSAAAVSAILDLPPTRAFSRPPTDEQTPEAIQAKLNNLTLKN